MWCVPLHAICVCAWHVCVFEMNVLICFCKCPGLSRDGRHILPIIIIIIIIIIVHIKKADHWTHHGQGCTVEVEPRLKQISIKDKVIQISLVNFVL